MIQIQSRSQFERAAERLTKEPQSIRRHEQNLYIVTNKTKGHSYPVRIERMDGKSFITCGCEAGTPHHGNRRPVVCKHAAALIIFLRAVRAMRAQASH
ncbi:MAG: hypothetical protein WCD76_12365 [Pyrinomonadaceae bacterium]